MGVPASATQKSMRPLPLVPVKGARSVVVGNRKCGMASLQNRDVLSLYASWPSPIVIIVDGPYGIGSFAGDPVTPAALPDWYRPHVEAWSARATPQTTLWFWNTEVGWATVHPLLKEYGWEYRTCHIWDKGIGHVAGNSNTQVLRKLPVVTEVCVQYVKEARFTRDGQSLSMKNWLRSEWIRTGLPLSATNAACGVRNAATRKYFTQDHLWYYPPPEAFEMLAEYANEKGDPAGRPYFSANGTEPIARDEWARMRAKFHCEIGTTNVWRYPPVRNGERLKNGLKCLHMNQKPLELLRLALRLSSDPGDVVWEPFGGLCSVAVAALGLGRTCYSAEIDRDYYIAAAERLRKHAA